MGSNKIQKVLIVEDDMLLSLVEERLVEQLGYKVLAKVTSGEDALRVLEDCEPDLILMDILLKGELDGIETMEQIRSSSNVPVIYLSGSSDRFMLERAKKTGFTEYLIKPVSIHDLKKPFEKAFGNGQQEAEGGNPRIYSNGYHQGNSLGKTA